MDFSNVETWKLFGAAALVLTTTALVGGILEIYLNPGDYQLWTPSRPEEKNRSGSASPVAER